MPVNSVLGPLAPGDLGVTLPHEHILMGWLGWQFDPDARFERSRVVARAIAALDAVAALGLKTFVDATPIDLGRDVSLLRAVAEQTPVQIICATGFYNERRGLPAYWREFMPEEAIADHLVRELTAGIDDTGIRAGVIKCGVAGFSKAERKFLRAAGMAQRRTGVPAIVHTDGLHGPAAVRELVAAGANPAKVVIGHCDSLPPDPAYYRALLDSGVLIGIDRIGLETYIPDRDRAAAIVDLVEGGFADRLLLSMDQLTWAAGGRKTGPPPDGPNATTAKRRAPGDYTHLFTSFIAEWLTPRIGADAVRRMQVDNPCRLFA